MGGKVSELMDRTGTGTLPEALPELLFRTSNPNPNEMIIISALPVVMF